MRLPRWLAAGALTALAVTLTTADTATAAGGVHRRARADRVTRSGPALAGPAAALQLTDEQKTQMQALRQSLNEQVQALRASGQVEQVRALRQAHREQFLAVLTDEQKANLGQLRAGRTQGVAGPRAGLGRGPRGRGPEGLSPGGGPFGAAPFVTALGLTDEQEAQMAALRADLRTRLQALRASGTVDRAQARVLFAAHREQVQALLTDEQRAKLEELRANRPVGPWRGRGKSELAGDGASVGSESASKTSSEAQQPRSWAQVKRSVAR